MESLLIDPRAQDWWRSLRLDTCADVVRFFLPEAPLAKTVVVTPRRAGNRDVFFKFYQYAGASWHFWFRRSKARCEYDNYAAFENIGIPTARRLAVGEERDALGRLRRAFIITEAIPRAWTLPQFVEEFCPDRGTAKHRQQRDELCRQMAALVRRIHDAGFFHHDLVWRNILVTWSEHEQPKIWWIDCPRGGFSRQRRRQLKDLASLDKMASKHCTRGERLLFLKAYGGDKQLAREVQSYRKRRWPDDI
jgi:tRNA A-37 threonylcarbamoyl transferase component Bud32